MLRLPLGLTISVAAVLIATGVAARVSAQVPRPTTAPVTALATEPGAVPQDSDRPLLIATTTVGTWRCTRGARQVQAQLG